MSILLVDDSPAIRRLHKNLLEAEGHSEVLTAASAHEAFKPVQGRPVPGFHQVLPSQ